jgi:hypothetical protein
MKILFLDVDGVLNNVNSSVGEMFPVEPYAVLLVDRIVQATGCQVVLSSSWRHMPDWRDVLKKAAPSIELLDRTPPYADKIRRRDKLDEADMCRGHNIQEWLDEHPEVERYAIVDDSADMLKEQVPNFFKTSWSTGLTDEIALGIINHLNQ